MTYSLKFTTKGDAKDPTFNQLLGINNEGKIAGYFGNGTSNPNKGYTVDAPYNQGNFHNENFPNSVQTQVTGINNADRTVGFWADALTGSVDNFGFVDHDGKFTDVVDPNGLHKASGGTTFEQLLGVNDHNLAVGFWNDATGASHGFTYDIASKSFTEVDVAGFTSTTTSAINNEGHVAGFVSNNGGPDISFIKEGNKYEWLTGPKGAVSVQALGINNSDQVVGSYTDGTGAMHGFLFDEKSNSYTTVDDPNSQKGPTEMNVVNGINDKGQLVGFYLDPTGNTDGMIVQVSHK